jgi:hypothetical protein
MDSKLERLIINKNKYTETNTINNFYPRIVSDTNITFPQEEQRLLNKSLKYNLHYNHKHRIQTLALETDTPISKFNPREQDPVRYQVVKNIENFTSSIIILGNIIVRKIEKKKRVINCHLCSKHR